MKVKSPDSRSTAWTYDGVQTLFRLSKLRAGRDLLQIAVIVCGMALASGPAMSAGGNIDAEAEKVLKAMSAYLSGLDQVSVQADVDIEVVMTDGQKLQLTSLVDVALERPGRLHVRRQGAYADAQILINGEKVTLHVTSHNAYAQLENAGSIDDGLDTLDRETGLDAPAADLFRSDPYDKLAMELTSGVYLGTTFVNGEECHYMAFRSDAADSQIWVRTGDRPLPMKYIVTSKWTTGSPQYSVRFRNWDTAPTLAENRFEFTPSPSDRRLETIPVNQVGEFSLKEAQQ
jgi:hypothetical protein